MNARSVVCRRCQGLLPAAMMNTQSISGCPTCFLPVQVDVFPSFFETLEGAEGPRALVDGQSSCFYHPSKPAVIPCEACGRFLCSLCQVELGGQRLCPPCLETGKKKGKIRNLQNQRVLYDKMALVLAVMPLFLFYFTLITAPIALFVALRYWKAPSSIVPRTKIRLVLALVLSSLQIAGWCALFYYLFSRAFAK